MTVAAPLLEAARANDHAALDMINVWSHGSRAHIGGNTSPGMWMLGMQMRLMERQARDVLVRRLQGMQRLRARRGCAQLTSNAPFSSLSGSRDQMTPPHAARELTNRIPHARTVMLEGSGHALMAEQPDAVLDALIDFL